MSERASFIAETSGPVAVTVPHMDDEALGCGALLASLAGRRDVRLFFCGDGLGSFSRGFIRARGAESLKAERKQETLRAIAHLGVSPDQAVFADLKEWTFGRQSDALSGALDMWLDLIRPSVVLAPFRLDCHPDHLALNRAVRAWSARNPSTRLAEYFVYYRLRLLPGGDMRKLIRPDLLEGGSPGVFADAKERALREYATQTTVYDPAWAKPVLSDGFIQEAAMDAEHYLNSNSIPVGTWSWLQSGMRARLVHLIEPRLKRIKDSFGKQLRVTG